MAKMTRRLCFNLLFKFIKLRAILTRGLNRLYSSRALAFCGAICLHSNQNTDIFNLFKSRDIILSGRDEYKRLRRKKTSIKYDENTLAKEIHIKQFRRYVDDLENIFINKFLF